MNLVIVQGQHRQSQCHPGKSRDGRAVSGGSEHIDELKISAGHFGREIPGVIVHRHVEQVEQHKPRPPMHLQEPPKPPAIIAAQAGVANQCHQPKEEANGFDRIADFLPHEARDAPFPLLLDADFEFDGSRNRASVRSK